MVSPLPWILSSRLTNQDETTNQLFYDMYEQLPVQTSVANIFADSRLNELLVNGETLHSLQFEILFATFQNLFSIESPSGILRINQTIDRDAICFKKAKCHLHLDIQVSGSNQFIQLLRVEVNVLDVNDNAPSFTPSRLLLNISESRPQGTRIVLPTIAEDMDSGDNGRIQYDHSGNSSNSIKLSVQSSGMDNSDLYLEVVEKLDREKNSVYVMEVVATDGGTPPKSGLLEIIIFVEDANDNMPQFEKDVYNVSIREDFPLESPFVRVRAVDPDEGVNGQVVYSLARPSMSAYGTVFHVNATTGDISLRQSLDYGREQEYILSIAATDSGPSPLPAYARLVISVIDVNDKAPTIRVKSHLQVPEAQPSDTLVGHVSVDDMDSGPNGQVHCAISLPEFLLEKLYPKVYKILTNKMFDREEQEDYSLTIECRDDGEPQLTATQQIIIRIADVNDNDPVFTQDVYSVNVKENNLMNIPIMRITAKDNDSGENAAIEYRLSNNSEGLLSIDASTGIVSAAGVFDFEEKTHYEFIATATDQGQPQSRTATATIMLNVVDFNDEAPVFLQTSYNFGTYENQLPGTEIGTVSAADRDTSPFDRFTFSIVQSKPAANVFQVDSNTGRIVSQRVLDREQYPVHHLMIAATNIAYPNPSSIVNVTVSVADRNDNAPMIEFPTAENYTLELAVDAAAGTFLTKIIARDADLGQNSRLGYAIAKGNEGDVFEVNQVDGTLTLKRPLSPLRAATKYSLVLVVRDFGEPEKSASAVLDIFVNKSADLTKSGGGYSSRLFNVNVDTIFSLEVIIILSSVMAALLIILIVTIIYIRRRNRAVVDRNATSLAKVVCRSPRTPKHLARQSEVSNNEYTYRAAESVDNKEEITGTLQLNSDAYKYELVDDVERPATHYTFAVSIAI